MVKNLTKQQALDLGLNLGFQKEDVDRTLEKEEKPGVGALALFIDWKNDLEESSEAECQTFNDALNSAMQQHSTDILKGQRLDPQHDGRPAGNSLASESRQETVNANKSKLEDVTTTLFETPYSVLKSTNMHAYKPHQLF